MGNRAKNIRRFLKAWSLLFAAGVALFFMVFFFGHHNIYLSQSYFLEKEVRNLHYQETHVPINYARAAEHYESLLERIRFDSRMANISGRYEQALARTRRKTRIIELIRAYESTGNEQRLAEAYVLFTSADYRRLEVYNFSSLWHHGEPLSEAWFLNRIGNPGAESKQERDAIKSGPDPAGGPSGERTYETQGLLPGARDFLATLFLWLVVSLVSVTLWVGTRKLLGG